MSIPRVFVIEFVSRVSAKPAEVRDRLAASSGGLSITSESARRAAPRRIIEIAKRFPIHRQYTREGEMEEEGTDSARLLPEWQNHPPMAYHERTEFEPAIALMPTAR